VVLIGLVWNDLDLPSFIRQRPDVLSPTRSFL
jgi:hypothetical protein